MQKHTTIQLSSAFRPNLTNNKPEFVNRSIVIPVDVPQLQVIHTVEINILSDTNSKSLSTPYAPQMVAVGQAIPAELVIYHSRAWNSIEAKDEDVEVGDEELDFFYEVQNHLDVWLISGRKRAHFTAKVRSNRKPFIPYFRNLHITGRTSSSLPYTFSAVEGRKPSIS